MISDFFFIFIIKCLNVTHLMSQETLKSKTTILSEINNETKMTCCVVHNPSCCRLDFGLGLGINKARLKLI